PHPKPELIALLDRSVSALARIGTPGGFRATVEHALSNDPLFGDTLPRLGYLSGQDLSSAPDVVERLLREARALVPIRILGLTVQIKNRDIVPYIEALNATPVREVRALLGDIAKKDRTGPAGQAASRALVAMEAPPPA